MAMGLTGLTHTCRNGQLWGTGASGDWVQKDGAQPRPHTRWGEVWDLC